MKKEFAIEVAYTHFPLHPDTPEDGMELKEMFAGRNLDIEAMQERMSLLMEQEGLPYPGRTRTYNSRLAQELGKWADTLPEGEKIHDALFRAYFVDSVNLAKVENLVAIAEETGLPRDEAEAVLTERRFRDDVDADWQRARDIGVTGVPTFVIGNQGLVGAQPYEQLQEFAEEAGAEWRNTGKR